MDPQIYNKEHKARQYAIHQEQLNGNSFTFDDIWAGLESQHAQYASQPHLDMAVLQALCTCSQNQQYTSRLS